MSVNNIAFFPLSNSIWFSPAIYGGVDVMGQAAYGQYISPDMYPMPYAQKVLYTDNLSIMMHNYIDTAPTMEICDVGKKGIAGIDLNIAPYFKGKQSVLGNVYINPISGAELGLDTSLWVFNFGNFPGQITMDGTYFLKITIGSGGGAVSYFSEPILLSSDWPDTSLFNFWYNSDNANKNIVNGNWWNDYPTNIVPYTLSFNQRAEFSIPPKAPKVVNIGYEAQNYYQRQINTVQLPLFKLRVDNNSIGIPYYMLTMITEALLADRVSINNYFYIVYNQNGAGSLSDLWKVKESDTNPLIYAECDLMQISPMQSALLSPYSLYTRIIDDTGDITGG